MREEIIGIVGDVPYTSEIILAARQYGYIVYHYHTAVNKYSVAHKEITGSYCDRASLIQFAKEIDRLLIITDKLDIDIIYAMSSYTLLLQSFELFEVCQNRFVEKLFLEEKRINVTPYTLITSVGELPEMLSSIGFPALLETNQVAKNPYEKIMILDHDMDESVFDMLQHSPAVLSAWVASQRQFEISVGRDVDGTIFLLPITENVYVNGRLKYATASLRLNPEWARELKRIATTVVEQVSGTCLLSVKVVLSDKGIFYVDKVSLTPSTAQLFSQKQVSYSTAQLFVRIAVGLPVLLEHVQQEVVLIPVYDSMVDKFELVSKVKPTWEHAYLTGDEMIRGILRLTGKNSMELLEEVNRNELFYTERT